MRGRGGRGRGARRAWLGALSLCACAACGPGGRKGQALPPAGSPRDDGGGLIARLSAGDASDLRRGASRWPDRADGPGSRGPASPSASEADGASAAGPTGRGRVGPSPPGDASPYANYHFDRPARPHAAPLPYGGRYVPVPTAEHGAIEGTVLWPHPPPAPERLRGSASRASGGTCPGGAVNQTLAVGSGSAVANAVVYLEDIASGRHVLGRLNTAYPNPTKHLQTGGVVEWRGCGFHPHVQVTAPIGSVLSLVSADEAIQIRATRVDGRARAALWSVALGAPGAAHEHLLERDGFVELRAERAGGFAASGWVVVAPHPYFAVTDESGRFSLEEIPPGAYTLVVWHEPVLVGYTPEGEPVLHTPPPVRRRVVVASRQAHHVTLRLPAAP